MDYGNVLLFQDTDGENLLSPSPALLKRSVSSPFDSFPVETREMSLLEDILSELPSLAPGYLSCRDLSALDHVGVTCLEDVSLDVDGCGDDVSDESGYSESASGTSSSPRADAAAAYAYCDSLATHVAKALHLYPLVSQRDKSAMHCIAIYYSARYFLAEITQVRIALIFPRYQLKII
jgi:hypothetical protein